MCDHIRSQQRELLPVFTAFPFDLSQERTLYGLKIGKTLSSSGIDFLLATFASWMSLR
jgi:hypothetical protein